MLLKAFVLVKELPAGFLNKLSGRRRTGSGSKPQLYSPLVTAPYG